MKLITAIVRTVGVDHVVKCLEDAGFRGLTIPEIKGIGDEATMNKPYTIHDKIQIIISDEDVEKVVNSILETARSGIAGDGVISVAPLDYAVKIKTKERLG